MTDKEFAMAYIEATCKGRPFDLPAYDEATEEWNNSFIESPNKNSGELVDLLEVPSGSAEEACEIYNYYNQNPVGEEKNHEENTR